MIVKMNAGYSSTRYKYTQINHQPILDIRYSGDYSTARGNEANWFGAATH